MYHVEHGHILLKYLQLEGDNLIHTAFYHFSNDLDLLSERIHTIRDIVKEHHNQTIKKRLQQHGAESPTLRSFNEGDIVYCHFPSKTIISDLKQPSKNCKCHLLEHCTSFLNMTNSCTSCLPNDGEVIEQTFHVSRLKQGLLRLPNSKSVRNINDYKLEMIRLCNKETCAPHSSQTVFHVHSNDPLHVTHDMDTSDIWCQSLSIFRMTTLDRKTDLLHLYHAHASMLTSTDALTDTVFSPDEQLQVSCNSFPSQYQSVNLNLVISRFFAITVTTNHLLVYGKPSHIVLKMI